MEAEKIPEEMRNRMVTFFEEEVEVEGDAEVEKFYMIQSFNSEDVLYTASIDNDQVIRSCTCYYFQKNKRLCKHLHLLKLHAPHLSFPQPTTINVFSNDAPIVEQNHDSAAKELSQIQYELSQASSIISTLNHNRNDLLRAQNSTTLDEAKLLKSNAQTSLNALQAFMDKYNNLTRMNTQRQ